jgi:uncharacterized membrane-anchored protein
LRLQQTVEGLSVAAISYYVIGLVGYLAKSLHYVGLAIMPEVLTGASVPIVVIAIWLLVRRIRNRHDDDGGRKLNWRQRRADGRDAEK